MICFSPKPFLKPFKLNLKQKLLYGFSSLNKLLIYQLHSAIQEITQVDFPLNFVCYNSGFSLLYPNFIFIYPNKYPYKKLFN